MLTFEQIKELIGLVAENRLQGLELERSGFRLKIDGQQALAAAAPPPAAQQAYAAPAASGAPGASGPGAGAYAAPPPPPPAATGPAVAPAPAAAPPAGHVLTSPIVGTYYSAPSPDAPSFTEVGARVKKGQVLCIIEAMKLMNEIESDVDGVIAEIYPQNAQAVEFGEPLFAIKT